MKSNVPSFNGSTRNEAEMLALKFEIEYKRNPAQALATLGKSISDERLLSQTVQPEAKDLTVGEAIDAYIGKLTGVLSQSTIRRYRKDREKFFRSLMSVKLSELTQPAIQFAVSSEARKYAPKSIHCAHGLLFAALDIYLPDFVLKTNLPPIPGTDLMIPEEKDVQALLMRIEGTWLEATVLLGACGEMRRSEICGLKFSDVNPERNTVTIRRAVVKDENGKWVVQERTKTVKSKCEVTLPSFIIEKPLSPSRDSEFIINQVPDTISKEFIDAHDAIGLKCRFHDLRHYNASSMLALNIPDKYAMERKGYSTPAP